MDFENQFTVSAPLESVWEFMLNAEEVAPCVPGAQITEIVDPTHYRGSVKIKLGAVQMTYRGELELQTDEIARSITLLAKGTETRGSGGASGVFTSRLSATEAGTRVDIHSQVDVTGRVAQFGRSIMQDVSNRLIQQFAANLEQKLQAASTPSPMEPVEDTMPSDTEMRAVGEPQTDRSGQASDPLMRQGQPRSAPIAPQLTGNEIRLRTIVTDVLRARSAAALRSLANRVEPK